MSCPKKCITTEYDCIGHLYPKIDKNLCVDCGKCVGVCPVLNNPKKNVAKEVWASWALDNEERKTSTSGGAAHIFGSYILSLGGKVYGSAMTDTGIQHIRVENFEDLKRLKGSKYVQSPILNILSSLKEEVAANIPVLFVGTPCQCAAVANYVGKDFENLYLADLVCTGVPPQKLLWEHLNIQGMPNSVRFRDESGTRLTVTENGRATYQKAVWEDYFLMGFAKHLFFRESCYNCPFADDKRSADITLGDFWGLGIKKPFSHSQKGGVSEIFVNSDKGRRLFEAVSEKLFLERREIDEAKEFNPRYNSPSLPHKNKDKFVMLYRKKGFKKAFKASMVRERLHYFAYRGKRKIKKLLKH